MSLSIIIVNYNTQHYIAQTIESILRSKVEVDYEIIVVDNKSTDGTDKLLRKIANKDKRFKVIINTKNFGPDRSSFYGLKNLSGDLVINISTDLEEPVELIDKFIESWKKGNKVAFGKKIDSDENSMMKIIKNFYYKIFNAISKTKIIQNCAGFMMDKSILKIIQKIDDPSPFLRGLIMEITDDPDLVPFKKIMRKKGISKNNFLSLYDLGITGVVKLSTLPLRLVVFFGFILSFIFFLVGLFYLIFKIFNWTSFETGVAPLVIGLFFISSFIVLVLGIIGEYLIVLMNYSKNIPNVVEQERINFE